MADQHIPIFFSMGTPHLPEQTQLINNLKHQLQAYGFEPHTMGDSQYSYLAPMEAIHKLMQQCCGAVILGLERTHALIGYDRQGSQREQEFIHRRQATVWCHLEAGMAYQAGLPLLILREDSLHIDGILDPAVSGYFVFSFRLAELGADIPESLQQLILNWGQAVRKRFAGTGKSDPPDELGAFVSLRPEQAEDANTIESDLTVGLKNLRAMTEALAVDTRLEFANYELRLLQLLRDRQQYGTNETNRSEISRVIYELNRVTIVHLNKTFVELCSP